MRKKPSPRRAKACDQHAFRLKTLPHGCTVPAPPARITATLQRAAVPAAIKRNVPSDSLPLSSMDLSDASVQKAITSVADLGSETRWALFSYSKVEAKSGPPAICLVDKGTGTLSELVAKLRADDIYYGYVRLVVGDATSVSTKFLFATYVGGKVSPLKRARVSVHKTVFAKSLPALNWEVFSEKLEELDENQIITNFTKTSGYGGWALASKSAREANAAGTLRRKPKAPAVPINVDAALEEEKKIQAQAAVRKEEAKKRSGKRLDILKQQKSSNSLQGNSTAALNASASAPAPATSTTSLAPPPSGVHALLAKAEADEKARQAESKRVEEEANKRRLDSARAAGEEAKAKAATTEAEFKRAAAELAEKKRSEEALQRQAEAAAAARKASEDANAVAVAAAAAAKKAAEEAQIAAANAVAARKAAEDAAERRRAEETKRQEEAKRQEEKERERKERKEREERERRDKKDKERKEKRDERADRKEKERKDKDRAPSTPTAPPPSTPVIIEETVVSLSVPAKQPEVAAPKSPQPKVRKILGIGQGATQGHRPDMEDRHVALSQLPFDADTAFVAVYDGHGGSPAAEYCKTVLHTNITRDPNYKTDVHKAIVNGFLKTDAEFLDVCRAAELEAGCTANAVFVTPTRMIVANAGDCRCILSRGGKVHLLSRDHKPYDATEKKRIEMAGYYVEDNRVDGRLAVSRAIGDIDFKQAKGKTAEQQAVTALPEIIDEEREDDDEFLVVACDGLWDVLENEGVLEFIATRFELMNLDQIAQELVDYAVEIGSMDNTTAVIVRFK